ncbi:MAG: IS91 family transposase [Anaerolineales bacterium]
MGLELADIFRQYGPAYHQKYAAHLLPSHRQAMRAIERCRTQALGGQVFACPACGEIRYSYHSCRNRHCPKCQHQQTQDWLEFQQGLLLPVPYFLLTFTLPSQLRQLASHNQKLIYNLLFRASAQATQKLAGDPRFVGGQIGMVGVLHTWTRNLFYHPHVHYLVPGGGVGIDGQSWLPARKNFFLPVKALSKLFRAAFQHALRKTALYTEIPGKVWQREWIVHCKPVGNGQAVLKYLAPYIHRVALSNRRLLSIDQRGSLETSQLTFQYRPTDTGQLKTCTLSVEHFIQRFLQHVLPRGFVKVCYFGFFGATRRSRLAALQQSLLPLIQPPTEQTDQPTTTQSKSWQDHKLSPKCGQHMFFQRNLTQLACRFP